MKTIRFKTHIKKDHIIQVPESIVLPEADAEVIIKGVKFINPFLLK